MGMDVEQDIIALSRQKWHWMSRRQTDPFHPLLATGDQESQMKARTSLAYPSSVPSSDRTTLGYAPR